MICNHSWQPYDEPVKDDVFERCRGCGVIRTVRKHAVNECLASDYGRAYFEKPEMWTFANGIPMNRHYIEIHLRHFERFGITSAFGGKNLLYVGPGIGQFVTAFSSWGWKITCVEISQWAATYLKNVYWGVDVHHTDFVDFRSATQYDCVVACHVLEHFRKADEGLERMIALLAPGGIIYIEVPIGTDLYVHDHWWHFDLAAITCWFTHGGLNNVEIRQEYGKRNEVTSFHCKGRKPSA